MSIKTAGLIAAAILIACIPPAVALSQMVAGHQYGPAVIAAACVTGVLGSLLGAAFVRSVARRS